MSELKPCDFLDNEIFVGDEVAFFALGYRMFTRGTVVKITNKCLFIDYDNSWNYDHHEEHTRQEQRQVIDLTALNRHAQPDNEPLTLDELREMSEQNEFCGAHIWIKDLESGWATVAITDRTAQDGVVGIWCVDTNDVYCEKDYGVTWLAYRSEPKEAQDER